MISIQIRFCDSSSMISKSKHLLLKRYAIRHFPVLSATLNGGTKIRSQTRTAWREDLGGGSMGNIGASLNGITKVAMKAFWAACAV
jgi:hypothetical protein